MKCATLVERFLFGIFPNLNFRSGLVKQRAVAMTIRSASVLGQRELSLEGHYHRRSVLRCPN